MIRKHVSATVSNTVLLSNLKPRHLEEIKRELTFSNPAYERAAALGLWLDNIARNLSFYTPRISECEVSRGFVPSFSVLTKHTPSQKLDWGVNPKFTLTKNQKEGFNLFKDSFENKKHPFQSYLLQLSTSLGKTLLCLEIARYLKAKTLVIVSANIVQKSWVDDLRDHYNLRVGKEVGIIQGSKVDTDGLVTIAMSQTLRRYSDEELKELTSEFGLTVFDEADMVGANQLSRIAKNCSSSVMLGVTATVEKNPWLKAYFGKQVCKIKTTEDSETSMKVRKVELINTEFYYAVEDRGVDFHELLLEMESDEERNFLIVEKAYQDWAAGESVIIVTRRIGHSLLLEQMIKDCGIKDVDHLSGETLSNKNYRTRTVDSFNSKKLRMLIFNAQALQRGANLNPLSSLHITMPFASKTIIEQLIGRLRRRHPEKTESKIVYYYDKRVRYLINKYRNSVVPVLRSMEIKGYKDVYLA